MSATTSASPVGAESAPAHGRWRAPALAAAVVVNVASIYLAQPLLPFIGDGLGAGAGPMAVVQGGIQVAFGVGLVVFGILADTTDRRLLLILMGLGLAASAGVAAVSPTYGIFLVAMLGLGASAAILPVAIAKAAAAGDLRALGYILSGAPAGIVIGRLVAGALGEVSWRLAFLASAVAALVVVALLRSVLAADRPTGERVPFGPAFRQMAELLRMPRNMLVNASNATVFLGWSAVWTMLAFQLEGEPFELGALAIGLVGLSGIGGAVSGQIGSAAAARLGERAAVRLALVIAGAGAAGLVVSGQTLWALVIALFVNNAAVWVVQAVNVPAASRRAGPARAARGAALLYLGNFLLTGVGAVIGAIVWGAAGWPAVGGLALAAILVAILLDLAGRGVRSEAALSEP